MSEEEYEALMSQFPPMEHDEKPIETETLPTNSAVMIDAAQLFLKKMVDLMKIDESKFPAFEMTEDNCAKISWCSEQARGFLQMALLLKGL